MSNRIIEVTDLSKSYIISHEGKERYTALRDVMSRKAKKLFSFPKWLKPGEKIINEEFWALKNINFKIEQGDRIGIIGRNGAGKSTLLKILSRITEPTIGTIKIRGRIASLLEVGTGFHPELTGRENIFLNGAILGMNRSEIKKHFDAIVDFAEVEKFLDTPVKRYSSGMYVRLAFAVAAHLEPEILVVDEVLSVGDVNFQKKCLGKMEEVSNNEGRTVLFVSHNTGVVSQLCKKCLWLNNGILMDMDETEIILRQYLNSYQTTSTTGIETSSALRNQITSITLINNGLESNSFLFKDEINIRFGYQKEVSLTDCKIGVAILNNLKQKIFTTHFTLPLLEKINNEIICRIPKNTLVPGSYSIDIAIFKIGAVPFQYLKDVFDFEVIDSGFALSGYSDYGFININCQWESLS